MRLVATSVLLAAALFGGAAAQPAGNAPPAPPSFMEPFFYYAPGAVEPGRQYDAAFEDNLPYALLPDVTAVVVRAHTDRVGSVAGNQRLSERRGQAMVERLVARGVRRELIRLEAVGETQPAVATADSVAEPLNRRVTIHVNRGAPQ